MCDHCTRCNGHPNPDCPLAPKASGLGLLKMLPSAWTSSTGVSVSTLPLSTFIIPRVSKEVESLDLLRPVLTPIWETAELQVLGNGELPPLLSESDDEDWQAEGECGFDSEEAELGVCGVSGATNPVPGGPPSFTQE